MTSLGSLNRISIHLLWGTYYGVEGLTSDRAEEIYEERKTKTSRAIGFEVT